MQENHHSEPSGSGYSSLDGADGVYQQSGPQATQNEPQASYQNEPQASYRRPEDHGHWEGTEFVFDEPVQMGESTITRLQTSAMVLADGVTRDDVVHALLNQVARVPLGEQ